MDYEEALRLLETEDQAHLLKFWPDLGTSERAELLADIEAVDWALFGEAREQSIAASALVIPEDLNPPAVVTLPASPSELASLESATQIGKELLSDGKVAALMVAGGQGTRLGFDGPKGMFPITPVKNKSLFQHFAETILATRQRYRCEFPWLIMTSPDNHTQTVAFFEDNCFFGLSPTRVRFFPQGVLPSLSEDDTILLTERHRIAFSPDGHGGALRALRRSGLLDELRAEGIRYISSFQVDNPLITPLDPAFVGLVHQHNSQVGTKVVRKASDDEKVGVFASAAGTTCVVEYTVLPESLARSRNPDGSRTFDFANIAAHIFDVEFALDITAPETGRKMPWYCALKKAPYVDLATGRRVEPDKPNAKKLEQFIFDAIPLAKNALQFEVRRNDEFSPVKNAGGPDSPETARQDLVDQATRWLEQCGVEMPETNPDERLAVEVSPLFAFDIDELRKRVDAGIPLDFNRPIYLGP